MRKWGKLELLLWEKKNSLYQKMGFAKYLSQNQNCCRIWFFFFQSLILNLIDKSQSSRFLPHYYWQHGYDQEINCKYFIKYFM